MSNNAVVIAAVRSPIARAHAEKGAFRDVRADDLSADIMVGLLTKANVPGRLVEDIHWGCVRQEKEQAYNVARQAALIAGLPIEVGATTSQRNCGSSLQALHQAAMSIAAGCEDVQIAGGVEHMDHLPMDASYQPSPRYVYRHSPATMHMGLIAENMARKYEIGRRAQDEWALRSHQRAVEAMDRGDFADEIVPVMGRDENGLKAPIDRDQGPRRETSLEALGKLPPVFNPAGGSVTAGNASPLNVGAAALLVMSDAKANELGVTPLVRVKAMAVAGVDPALMGIGPVPAVHKALARAGLTLNDIDLIEINEAFAVQTLACIKVLGLDSDKVNVRGGAIAIGHPLGASGARIATTLIHAMKARNARYGLATMCIGGGQGIATIFEGIYNTTMKYAIIIPDGCADEPLESLGGKTPLQAAKTPNMDAIVQRGVCGRSDNVPPTLTPASDVATLSLFGYDPLEVYTGRAPLETAAMGIPLGQGDWAIRCNLVNVDNEEMRDFTAGHISSDDGKELIQTLQANLGGPVHFGGLKGTLEFHPGVSYRNILVYRGTDAPFTNETKTQPPHDVPDKPIAGHVPRGPGADFLNSLMTRSRTLFANHPTNKARIAAGKRPATQCWLWGQGRAPSLKTFHTVYSKKGAIISAVDLVRGVGVLLGWTRIDVPGATGYLDTDYAAKGRYGIEALKSHDIVCVHVEAPDEASHEGKAEEKIKALERIDEHIVGPMEAALKSYGDYRILVSPDHRTLMRTRADSYGMVPVAVAGKGVSSRGRKSYDEIVAAASDLEFAKGYKLMSWFLG